MNIPIPATSPERCNTAPHFVTIRVHDGRTLPQAERPKAVITFIV